MTLLGGPTPARFSVHTQMEVYLAPPCNPVSVKPSSHTGCVAHHALVRTAGNSLSYMPVPARLLAMTLYLVGGGGQGAARRGWLAPEYHWRGQVWHLRLTE